MTKWWNKSKKLYLVFSRKKENFAIFLAQGVGFPSALKE